MRLSALPTCLLAIFAFWAKPAQAIVFSLEVGPKGLYSDRLEVSQDPDFKAPLISSRIGQSSQYLVNFENSGIYYYRLLKDKREVERDQVVVVLEAPPPGQLIEVNWKEAPGELSYRLSFSRPNGPATTVLSARPLAYFRGNGVPWVLRVQISAKNGLNRPVDALRMHYTRPPASGAPPVTSGPPALAAPPEPKAPPEPVILLDPYASDEDQMAAEPEYSDLLKGPERKWWDLSNMLEGGGSIGRTTLEPLVRRHSFAAWIRSFREEFAVSRRDRYASVPTQGLGTGFSLRYYLQPTFPLQFEGDTHATETNYGEGGTEPPGPLQERARFLIGALFDVANLESRNENYSIDVGTNIALVQVPLRVDNQRVPDIGFQAGGHYYPWGLQLVLRGYKSQSHEASLTWSLPWKAVNWEIPKTKQVLKPAFSAYQRQTRAKDGSIKSVFNENGFRLGLQLDF